MTEQSTIYIIAGCNGAGKSTLSRILLPQFLSVHALVNPDDIARGLNPLDPVSMDIKAEKLALHQMADYIAMHKSFAFETTAADRAHLAMLKQAKEQGYQIYLIYLFLTSPSIAIRRVAQRVREGGHDVPEKDIIRRHGRGITHILNDYLPLAHEAWFYEEDRPLKDSKGIIQANSPFFARKRQDGVIEVIDRAIWDIFIHSEET